MKRKNMKIARCAALALCLAALRAPAAEPAPKARGRSVPGGPEGEAVILNMQRALSIALDTNLTVLTARENVESAIGRGKAAASALGPYLSLQGEGNAYDTVPAMPDNELSARVAVTQSLYAGGANRAQARQGRLAVRQARQSLADTREAVAQTVWNAFCDVLYRREVLRNTRNALDYYINAEKELVSRVMYGLSTNLDLTRVRQQKENARAQNITAGNDLEASRIELCRLLRMTPETRLALSGSLEDGLPSVEEARKLPDDLDGRLKQVLESRGDYQATLTAREAQRQEITIARAGLLPKLSLSSGYRFGYRQSGLADAADDNQWTAALTLDVPVFDSGATSGGVRAAKAGLRAADNAVAEKEESIRAELADNWLGLLNALESLSASRANVELARESLAYAESGYREGVNTQLDVLQARSDLTNALQQLALALRDARSAQAALWKSEGVFIENAFRQAGAPAGFGSAGSIGRK